MFKIIPNKSDIDTAKRAEKLLNYVYKDTELAINKIIGECMVGLIEYEDAMKRIEEICKAAVK